jgi:hypothetical protein
LTILAHGGNGKLLAKLIADLELWNRVRLFSNAVDRRLSSTEQLNTIHRRLTYSLKTACRETSAAEEVFADAAREFRNLRIEIALRNYETSGNHQSPRKLPSLSCGNTT